MSPIRLIALVTVLIYVRVYTNYVRLHQTGSVRTVLQTLRVDLDDTPASFWDRLESASQAVGLSYGLSDIGRELDVWPSAVQKWRDGVSLPSRTNMIALARNRGVNLEWLWTGRGPRLAENEMDASTREFLAIWNALPREARDRLLGAARYEKNVSLPSPSDQSPDPDPKRTIPFRPRRKDSTA